MRRVAALYDVHGNLPALDAALEAVARERVDAIVVGGDVVLGPMPRETLARLRELELPTWFIRGNCDRLVVEAFDKSGTAFYSGPGAEAILWVAEQLDRAERDFLAALPLTISLDIADVGRVLFCHATPRSDDEIVTSRTPAERVAPMLAGVIEPIVVCGHTHIQMDRPVGQTRLLNAGSIGMPIGTPGAHWLLLGPELRLMRTPYDADRAAGEIRGTRYPGAEQSATGVVDPPSEEKMLDALTKTERG